MSKVRIYQEDLPPDIQELLDAADPVVRVKKRKGDKGNASARKPDLGADPGFVSETLKADVVEEALQAMKRQGVTQSELARRIGKSRQYVSRLLNESANFTLETIAELSCALGQRVTVKMYTPGESVVVLPSRDASSRIEKVEAPTYRRHIKSGAVSSPGASLGFRSLDSISIASEGTLYPSHDTSQIFQLAG